MMYGPMLRVSRRFRISDVEFTKMRGIGYDRTPRKLDKYFDAMDEWFDTPFNTTKSRDRRKQGAAPIERIKRYTKRPRS